VERRWENDCPIWSITGLRKPCLASAILEETADGNNPYRDNTQCVGKVRPRDGQGTSPVLWVSICQYRWWSPDWKSPQDFSRKSIMPYDLQTVSGKTFPILKEALLKLSLGLTDELILERPWCIRGFPATRVTNRWWRCAIVAPVARSHSDAAARCGTIAAVQLEEPMESTDSLTGTYSRAAHRVEVYRACTLAQISVEVLVTMATGRETKNDCCWRQAASFCWCTLKNITRFSRKIKPLRISPV
jgi:hypothetical protein